MLEIAIVSFTTFFATIGPLDVGIIFATISAKETAQNKKKIAWESCFFASIILLVFALSGDLLLKSLGISLASLKVAGGILLLLIAIDMVFAKESGGTSTTSEEKKEATCRQHIAVFPLATPLIAGPGTIGALILLISAQKEDFIAQAVVLGTLLFVIVLTLICMFLSQQIQKIFGITGMQAISRVFGIILSALAIEFIFNGISQSNLFSF